MGLVPGEDVLAPVLRGATDGGQYQTLRHEFSKYIIYLCDCACACDQRLYLQVSMSCSRQYLCLKVPSLAEGRPSLVVGDKVLVCEPGMVCFN